MANIDPGQLEQVIMNLAVNARDAMPTGGVLRLETGVVELDHVEPSAPWPATAGRFAMLAIGDTGMGMDEATRGRIFEPFFTTKESGKGTGLGLAMVYGIVKQNGGFISVTSEPGAGTTFRIYLPVAGDAEENIPPVVGGAMTPRGSETILIAEDERAVRSVARFILERQGYTVLEAPNGAAALSIASDHEGSIDLLLTDVVMPGMSGRKLAEDLGVIRPSTRVLYMSGYTDDAVVRHGVLTASTAYVQKPFGPEALAAKVREVLDA
jgi:CheY-like chemotaxis protein